MTVTGKSSKNRENVFKAAFQGPDMATAQVTVTGSMPATTITVPVYDSNGTILGYMALYANATLT